MEPVDLHELGQSYRRHFREASVEQLIAAFNSGAGSKAWVGARALYLAALSDSLLATGLDCSGFISDKGMSLSRPIERRGNSIVPVE